MGIRFGGNRGGIQELLAKGPSSQIYDLNVDPVSPGEVAHIEVEDDDHDAFNVPEGNPNCKQGYIRSKITVWICISVKTSNPYRMLFVSDIPVVDLTDPTDSENSNTTELTEIEEGNLPQLTNLELERNSTEPTDLDDDEKAKRAVEAQLVWLKNFLQESPSMIKVGDLELRHCIGRIKEAYEAWSSGQVLPMADMWRKLMPNKPDSVKRKLSWLEKLTGNRGPRPQREINTGDRYRVPTADLGVVAEAALQLRVRKGKKKAKKLISLTKQFLEASQNREKIRLERARILEETIDLSSP